MSEFMEIIKNRRSIRKFEDTAISPSELDTLLEAARWAPSWANTQCWEIVVVRDESVKRALQDALPEGNPGRTSVMAAPMLLVVCGRRKQSGYYKGNVCTKFGDWFLFDLGIMTQNIALAAHAIGLGTVVLGLFDHDKARQIVNAPEDCEVVAILPIGRPAKTPPAPPRREQSAFVHHEHF